MVKKPGPKPIPVRPVSKGLPQKEIILDQVIYWMGLQATAEEIAGSFFVSPDTLDNRLKEHFGCGFSELFKIACTPGKLSLRRYQFDLAKRNSALAIFLGKNWLNQTDGREDKKYESGSFDQIMKDIAADNHRQSVLLKEQEEVMNKLRAKLGTLSKTDSEHSSGE